ncbi:MAG: hypothetical protein K2J60_19250 [Acetatifactor sp.]|nr:hypothetical protein [Acetatifactor sp.]
MGKNTHLLNIYLKIHNKKPLTMDDLGYLAEYDPECFAKTCKNVIYNIPEAKPIMEPAAQESLCDKSKPETPDWRQNIAKVLKRLKRLERNEFPGINIDNEEVKNLLGNLYMELLFPHNDQYSFMSMSDGGNKSSFDKKV